MPTRILQLAMPLICLVAVPSSSFGNDTPSLESLAAIATQLASPISNEKTAGEQWLKANEDAAFLEIARLIEHGDINQQTKAADTACILLSPWSRSILQGEIHKGQINLFLPARPTARPVDHAYAARIRSAALASLTQALKQSNMPVDAERDDSEQDDAERLSRFPSYEEIELVRSLCDCLAEVANADTIDKLAALIDAEPSRIVGPHLMDVLDTYYGLPDSIYVGGVCGTMTPDEFRAYEIEDTARYTIAKEELLKWHNKHRDEPFAQRVEAVLDMWDDNIESKEQYAYYTDSGQWTTQTLYESMIRLGEPAVDAIQRRATDAQDKKYWHRGAYEVAIAAITGEVNNGFVKAMFQGETFEQMLACEIIAAAGNRDFEDRLAEMVQSNGPYMKASYTLAVVYRAEAIPILEKAHSRDYIAFYAIAELRAWGE